MTNKNRRPLMLKVPKAAEFIRLVTGFVDQAGAAFGLQQEPAEELTLASEEVMAYLIGLGPSEGEVLITCFAGSHYVEVDFTWPLDRMALRAFNMTAQVFPDDADTIAEMGLVIASRLADRFHLIGKADGHLELSLIKEFTYPQVSTDGPLALAPVADFTLQEPDAGQLDWLLNLIMQTHGADAYPRDFLRPGKVIDMAAAGEYQALIALGPAQEIGGGIVWRQAGAKTVEFFGPYIFHKETAPAMARALLDGCVGRVARTKTLVLLNRRVTAALPKGYMEPLGAIRLVDAGGKRREATAYFREIHEDLGAVAWCHPALESFLVEQYRRLVLPREIRKVDMATATKEPHSVLSAEMDRRLGLVTLRPTWPGKDLPDNLLAHVQMVKEEGFLTVFFELDAGVSWQAEFAPELLTIGFLPRLLLPHAGVGDVVVFELGTV